MDKPVIAISVRNLVEFTLRAGDLEFGFSSGSRAEEGIRLHRSLQCSRRGSCLPGAEYCPEVTLSLAVERGDIALEVCGRADGVITDKQGTAIEEIKTTVRELAAIEKEGGDELHWGQARCYGYIYAVQNDLPGIAVRLTYVQTDTGKTKSFRRGYTLPELKTFFEGLVDAYLEWARTLEGWARTRDISIASLEFPFGGYRRGQREFAVAVYRALRDGRSLFAQAPTGTGKTMAVLFPAVKSLGEGRITKVFYLTAKTVTRAIAEKAFDALRDGGLRFKTVTVTAREKICFRPGGKCDPEECPYAKGYYDRVKGAVRDAFRHDVFTRGLIEELARAHRLCPFEFSLDLTLWADGIVCDYNYVFDPRVYLRRFFEEGPGPYAFLVDEAHNLVDRAREMYSAEFAKEPVLALRRSVERYRKRAADAPARFHKLSKALGKINTRLIEARKSCAEGGHVEEAGQPRELYPLLRAFLTVAEEVLQKDRERRLSFEDDLLERFFEAHWFLRASEFYDERYVTYTERSGNDVRVRLFCMDPSRLLREALGRGTAAVFFSATLTPIDYFVQVFGAEADSPQLRLPSPFPRGHLRVFLNDRISTKYAQRELTYDRVRASIVSATGVKTGNYLVFFPSYKYLREVHRRFLEAAPGVRTIAQSERMSEPERDAFLREFSVFGERTLVGFAVMGGVFGEGIDLVGERLSGVVIVGVGLPQISPERELIRAYYDGVNGNGFAFAFQYPGMNKVLQAAGRVIRSETDRGIVLLIDERFSSPSYRSLIPEEWRPLFRVSEENTLRAVREFWEIP